MIILDTNVVSELMSPLAEACVAAWADRERRGQLLTTAITALELRRGAEKLEDGRRRRQLESSIDWALDELIGGRISRFDRHAGFAAASWEARCKNAGRPVSILDVQIAGIAISRSIPIATRDIGDFSGMPVKVVNPWEVST